MRELMERNGLGPDDFVSVIFTCTDDLNAEFPAVAARALGLDRVPLLCNREIDVPGAMERVIRVLAHYYAPAAHSPSHVYLGETQKLRADLHARSRRDRSTFVATSSRRSPATSPAARPARRRSRSPARASPSSPRTSRRGGRTRRSPRRSRAPPAPPTAIPTRARPCCAAGSPSVTRPSPAEVAVANGSCEILLAAALALCEPGAELVYALALVLDLPVPGAAVGRARDPGAARRGRRPRPRRDARRDHRRDAARAVCNPNNPTSTHLPGGADRRASSNGCPSTSR